MILWSVWFCKAYHLSICSVWLSAQRCRLSMSSAREGSRSVPAPACCRQPRLYTHTTMCRRQFHRPYLAASFTRCRRGCCCHIASSRLTVATRTVTLQSPRWLTACTTPSRPPSPHTSTTLPPPPPSPPLHTAESGCRAKQHNALLKNTHSLSIILPLVGGGN